MPSPAFTEWHTSGVARLDELERVHADARGTGPGRRWGTEQLNGSLFVALVAQFQTYCRDLHDEAIDVHVVNGNAGQGDLLRRLMSHGRRLDTQTPRTSVLANDFLRVGFNVVDEPGRHLMDEFCANADLYCSLDHLHRRIDIEKTAGDVATLAEAAALGRDVWADVADLELGGRAV